MNNTKIIWILLAMTLVMMIVIRFQNESLITISAPLGIISLEFSNTALKVENIRSEWTGSVRQSFYLNTILDYLYLFFYGLFLYFASSYFSWLRPGTKKIGSLAAKAGIAAAGLDAVENALMVLSVTFGGFDLVALLTTIIASTKFILVAFAVLYVLISSFSLLFYRRNSA